MRKGPYRNSLLVSEFGKSDEVAAWSLHGVNWHNSSGGIRLLLNMVAVMAIEGNTKMSKCGNIATKANVGGWSV